MALLVGMSGKGERAIPRQDRTPRCHGGTRREQPPAILRSSSRLPGGFEQNCRVDFEGARKACDRQSTWDVAALDAPECVRVNQRNLGKRVPRIALRAPSELE